MAGSRASYAARGLTPRVISALLARLGATPGLAGWSVSVSYLEIYNEALYDLLDLTAQPQELALYEDGRGRVQVGGLVGWGDVNRCRGGIGGGREGCEQL